VRATLDLRSTKRVASCMGVEVIGLGVLSVDNVPVLADIDEGGQSSVNS